MFRIFWAQGDDSVADDETLCSRLDMEYLLAKNKWHSSIVWQSFLVINIEINDNHLYVDFLQLYLRERQSPLFLEDQRPDEVV